jgi:hypothetical protein
MNQTLLPARSGYSVTPHVSDRRSMMRSPRPLTSVGSGRLVATRPDPLSAISTRTCRIVCSIVMVKSVSAWRTQFVASSETMRDTVSTTSRGRPVRASRTYRRAAAGALGVFRMKVRSLRRNTCKGSRTCARAIDERTHIRRGARSDSLSFYFARSEVFR